MTIKITEQGKKILVRRWKYCTAKKRSMPTTVCSISIFHGGTELPANVIEEHSVDKDEQKVFSEFMEAKHLNATKTVAKYSLLHLTQVLNEAKTALLDPDLKSELTLEEYSEVSESINEIKKLVTKNKNALKRRSQQVDKK